MKTIIVLLLLSCAGALIYASSQSPATTEIAVLRDITDKHLSQPDATEILKLYDLTNNKWNGDVFYFSNVSDVSYNKNSEAKLAAQNKWLSNEFERDKEIQKFKSDVSTIISSAEKETIGKNNSSVYLPIARELLRLSQSKSEKRILIIYSDLMENDPDVSLYNKREFELLKSNPDKVKQLFNSWQPLPALSGIEVYIVYHPANTNTDKEFNTVSAFYKSILESKGAKVYISANLD
jgi:hypothetical protein